MPNQKTGLDALISPYDSVLMLIDHQPFQFANLHSHEPTLIINNVVALAKLAKAFDIPPILTTVLEERGGLIIKGIQDVFPDHTPINRSMINAWEDERILDAVVETGRKKIIMAALWTEICLAMPVIQALGEGYDVFIITDASGGVSAEAHDMAIRRMIQAGAVPMTWMALGAELQRDWAREATALQFADILLAHGGGTGIAFGWEMQLLHTPAGVHAPNSPKPPQYTQTPVSTPPPH